MEGKSRDLQKRKAKRQKFHRMTKSLEGQKALADAISGVAGSLVSLWTFYPIEVFKTNLQAGSVASTRKSFYQGCQTKTLHTATSNFVYFYLYSWIFSIWRRRRKSKFISPATRLLLSAVAAMMNTFITLPLDVLSSKHVTELQQLEEDDDSVSFEENNESKMDDVWGHLRDDEKEDDESYSEFKDAHAEFIIQSKMAEFSPRSMKVVDRFPSFRRLSSYESLDIAAVFQNYYYDTRGSSSETFQQYTSLWKGLVPALLLCSNPSIHYTAFDMTKNRILSRRSNSAKTLSMSEAFLVGLFAKFVATIATYPLIRAKVILMVTSEKSMIATLCRSYNEEGVRGLYKGCDWQLLHTVLKSALMMMVREKISNSAHRIIVGKPKQM